LNRSRTDTDLRLLEISLKSSTLLAAAVLLLGLSPARSETPEQWIELGARVHGAFGAFIPVGIRIGLDAKERLKADARGLSVTYYNGEKPPCPCMADGVMIATQASPGQGTLQMGSEKAPPASWLRLSSAIARQAKARNTASPTNGCRPS